MLANVKFRLIASLMLQALRSRLRTPRFTIAAALLLSAGIGVNTAAFSLVNAILLKPLPFRDSERLVLIGARQRASDISYPISPAEFWDWKQASNSLEDLAGFASGHPALLVGREPLLVRRTLATASLFSMLGVQAAHGRVFAPSEAQVVVLTHDFWVKAFDSDPRVVGSSLNVDGEPSIVLGVLPRTFQFFTNTDIWTPMNPPKETRDRRAVGVIGKLREGKSIESAKSELTAIATRLAAVYPNTNAGFESVVIAPLLDRFVYKSASTLRLLLGSVVVVLLIICANVGGLQLARTEARLREFAIRGSLGATRGLITVQILFENVALAGLGGIGGLAFAHIALRLVVNGPFQLPRSQEITIDDRTLVFCLGMSCLAGLLCGLLPALRISSDNLANVLKEGGRISGGSLRLNSRIGFSIVTQTALTVVLVGVASLLVESVNNLQKVELGFNVNGLATADFKLSPERYKSPFSFSEAVRRILGGLAAIPGVEAVGATNGLPLIGQAHNVTFAIHGRTSSLTESVQYRFVSLGYFEAMRIPLQQGRLPQVSDGPKNESICVVNAAMARRFWPNESVLGKRLQLPDRLIPGAPWMTVVGVVADSRQLQLTRDPVPEVYLPIAQFPNPTEMTFVLRVPHRTSLSANAIRTVVRDVDAMAPVPEIRWMEDQIAQTTASSRYGSRALSWFAGWAVFLAATGIYAAVAVIVTQRAKDMGVRIALGATTSDLIRWTMAHGLRLATAGIVAGLILLIWVGRYLSALLYEVKPLEPRLILVAISAVFLPLLIATYLPARGVSRVDPAAAIRSE